MAGVVFYTFTPSALPVIPFLPVRLILGMVTPIEVNGKTPHGVQRKEVLADTKHFLNERG